MRGTSNGYVSADFVTRTGTVVRQSANAEQLEEIKNRMRVGEDLSDINYLDLVSFEELQVEDVEPLTLQATDFLDSVRTGAPPEVDAEAGSAAVRTAERIIESAGLTAGV